MKNFALAVILFFVAPLQVNHPPTVKINAPLSGATLSLQSPVSYEIHVSDPEDGDSRYDEINSKEVLLEISRLNSRTTGPATRPTTTTTPATPATAGSAAPLSVMAANNCFNCHDFKAKSLGPSFFEIAKHYKYTSATTDTLTRRIRAGSSGIWGRTEKMPSHPQLSLADIRLTVDWIFRYAARSDLAFLNGSTGILHFPANQPGTYQLTAIYTDHGPKDRPGPRLTSTDHVTVTVR